MPDDPRLPCTHAPMQKVATPAEADKLATDAMLAEYMTKKKVDIQRQLLFNMAVEVILN